LRNTALNARTKVSHISCLGYILQPWGRKGTSKDHQNRWNWIHKFHLFLQYRLVQR